MREVAKTRKRFFSVILEEWKCVLAVATTDRSVLSFRLTTWLNDAHPRRSGDSRSRRSTT